MATYEYRQNCFICIKKTLEPFLLDHLIFPGSGLIIVTVILLVVGLLFQFNFFLLSSLVDSTITHASIMTDVFDVCSRPYTGLTALMWASNANNEI